MNFLGWTNLDVSRSTMLYCTEHYAMRHDHETWRLEGDMKICLPSTRRSLNQSYFFVYRINYMRHNNKPCGLFWGYYNVNYMYFSTPCQFVAMLREMLYNDVREHSTRSDALSLKFYLAHFQRRGKKVTHIGDLGRPWHATMSARDWRLFCLCQLHTWIRKLYPLRLTDILCLGISPSVEVYTVWVIRKHSGHCHDTANYPPKHHGNKYLSSKCRLS